MINKINELKKMTFGPDAIGIAPADRFDKNDPIFKILPETKSIICLSYRILRGAHRGIEEGTAYHFYTTMAIEVLEETIMPMMALRCARIIEENGFIALPQKKTQVVMQEEDSTNPEMLYNKIYRGKKNEYQMNYEESAAKCGLGEIGLSGTLLTDDFGPLQRYCFVLTDAVLEPTPEFIPHLCDKCGECIKACDGHAISEKGLDSWQCAVYYKGVHKSNPFMTEDFLKDHPEREAILNGDKHFDAEEAREIIKQIDFLPMYNGYSPCLCGKKCDYACFKHLKEVGRI